MNDLETLLHDLFEGKSSVLSCLTIKHGSVITTQKRRKMFGVRGGSLLFINSEKEIAY